MIKFIEQLLKPALLITNCNKKERGGDKRWNKINYKFPLLNLILEVAKWQKKQDFIGSILQKYGG